MQWSSLVSIPLKGDMRGLLGMLTEPDNIRQWECSLKKKDSWLLT